MPGAGVGQASDRAGPDQTGRTEAVAGNILGTPTSTGESGERRKMPESAREYRKMPENTGKLPFSDRPPQKRPRKPDFQFIFLFLSMVPNLNGRDRTYYERFVTFSFAFKLRNFDQ